MSAGTSVVVRPNWEIATRYGAHWLEAMVINKLKERGMRYRDLYADLAVKSEFDGALGDPNVIYLTGTGHGNSVLFAGQNNQILLTKGSDRDASLLRGKWGCFLSCSFGLSADWWVSRGMKGFFGYDRTYYFVIGVFPDSRASWFFKSHHAFDLAALDGKTWREAADAALEAYNRAVLDAPEDCKRYLVWDRDGMVARGDMDGGPFVKPPSKPSLWCRFLYWLLEASKCPMPGA